MVLLSITKTPNNEKKYKMQAKFLIHNKNRPGEPIISIVKFGAKGYSDYTKNKSEQKKLLYIARHSKNEDWSKPFSRGALSRWILWNKPTVTASIKDYKKRFGL